MGLRLGFAKVTNEIGKQEAFAVTGTYGQNIPYVFGSRIVDGKYLWADQIEERVSKSSKKKGAFLGIGGTKVTTITYDYYATFAVWFGEGPAAKLVRLWMDDLLVFDGADLTDDPEAVNYPPMLFRGQLRNIVSQEFSKQQENRIPYKFYNGTEDQNPDATIALIEGINNTPAYRGMCYLVFDRLKLAQFDNKVPKIRAEIVFDVGGSDVRLTEHTVTVDPTNDGHLQIDFKRGLIYSHREGVNEVNLTVYSLEGDVIRSVTYPSVFNEGPVVIDMENVEFYSRVGTGGDRHNGYTAAIEYTDHTNTQPLLFDNGGVMLFGEGQRHTFTSGNGILATTWLIGTHDTELKGVGVINIGTTTNQTVSHVVPAGGDTPRFGYGFYITAADVFRMVRADGADGSLKADFGDLTPANFGLDTFTTAANPRTGYDEGNGRVVGFVQGTISGVAKTVCFAWDETLGVVWKTIVPFGIFTTGDEYSVAYPRLSGGRWAWTNGTQICAVNLSDGTINEQYDGVNNGYSGFGNQPSAQVFDDSSNKIYMWNKLSGGNPDELQIIQLFLGEQNGSTLAKVIRKVASECGMTEGEDYDVSGVDDVIVPGYMLTKTDEGKKHLEPILEFFQITTVDRDHRIYFERRETSSLGTVTVDDMVSNGRNAAFVREREEETSLPQVFEVNYIDRLRDYEAGVQRVTRASFPIATTNSENIEDFNIDLALSPTVAKQQVEKLMYASWIERNAYSFNLPQRWLAYTPGDVVTFNQPGGYSSRILFDKIGIGADFTMKTHSVEQTQGMHVSYASSATGQWNVPPAYLSAPSEPFLLDIPYLMDSDSDIDTTGISQGYWAGSDYGVESNSWPGASLYRSYDNTVYDQIETRINRADWGVLSADLPEPPGGPEGTDDVNVLKVFMNSGYLSASERTISYEDMLTGLYNRAVICHADGTFELLYFSDVTEISSRSVELRSLLRGRRGTDTNLLGTAGDKIVFLSDGEYDDDTSNYSTFAQPIDRTLTDDQFYKVVTRGLQPNEALAEDFNFTCADLKPYAPVHVQGYQQTTDEILIEWVRRTRLGGEMEDLVDVPLSEETERYEIDIYNVAGTVVLRTLTSTTQSVVYEAADVLADQLTANPATITVGIYQMSASVGRGFGRIVTIEV